MGDRRDNDPRLLQQAPVCVLVLDPRSGDVVLESGDLSTAAGPVSAAAWSDAVQLTDRSGVPYDGDSPLDRAAAGITVPGERVLVTGAGGRRAVWATSLLLPASHTGQHLMLFFDFAPGRRSTDENGAIEVRNRAIVAAGLALTISDPRLSDQPLVFVNPAFERTTGFTVAESLGRNCRFLQGPDTDPDAVEQIRALLREQRHGSVTLLNYRKDGTSFWNELSLSPVVDDGGELTHVVGIQSDVTIRVQAEQERGRHLRAERHARAQAERAQLRLAVLSDATAILAATLDVDESLRRLTDLVVPMLADWCFVELAATDIDVRRVVSRCADPADQEVLRRLEQLRLATDGLPGSSPLSAALPTDEPVLMTDLTPAVLEDSVTDPPTRELVASLGAGSAMLVPLRARSQILGLMALVSSGSGRVYEHADLTMAADLARRAALTVDNARLYQREHHVAESLQRSLLPALPSVAGLDLAARYLPAVSAAQVGGDWYDLFALPDGTVGIAVGDVMGHDLTAAAAMGQLRSVLRSYAWQGDRPAVVLERLDQLVQALDMAQLATAIYARLVLPSGGEPGRLRLANAGHLPPVLRLPDGTARLVTEGRSMLIGAVAGSARDEVVVTMEPGAMLVLCTDGLVERRAHDLDHGLERLRAAVADAPTGSADQVCDHLLASLSGDDRDDDVALLVVLVR